MSHQLSTDPHHVPKATNLNERNALGLVASSYAMMEMVLKMAKPLEKEHCPWRKPHFTPERLESMQHVHQSMKGAVAEYDASLSQPAQAGEVNAVDKVRIDAMRHAPAKAVSHLKHLQAEIDKLQQQSGQHEDQFRDIHGMIEAAQGNLAVAEELMHQQDKRRGAAAGRGGR